jgi:hypothetical protein
MADMEDERLRVGDRVTVRKGAPMPPDGKRRLEKDFQAKVIGVDGRRVKVAMDEHIVDADGSRMVTPFAVFDLTYVYRMDS